MISIQNVKEKNFEKYFLENGPISIGAVNIHNGKENIFLTLTLTLTYIVNHGFLHPFTN